MNISIILAHPNPGSFNHAIADTAADALRKTAIRSRSTIFARNNFPRCPGREFQKDAKLDPVVAPHCKEIAVADGIIIVHPNWWGMPPAILKGWIDRVLRMEVAYRFGPMTKAKAWPSACSRRKQRSFSTPPTRRRSGARDFWRSTGKSVEAMRLRPLRRAATCIAAPSRWWSPARPDNAPPGWPKRGKPRNGFFPDKGDPA